MEGLPLSSLAPSTDSSPLARARIRDTLTLEQAAARAGITTDEARWLEEGRLYRFADADAAIAATIAYAAALGALAEGTRASTARRNTRARRPRRRWLVLAAMSLLAIGIAIAVATAALQQPGSAGKGTAAAGAAEAATRAQAATVQPAPARDGTAAGDGNARGTGVAPPVGALVVDTIDAAGRPAAARALAARVSKLGYRIGRVTTAGRTDEPDTAVYFEPGGAAAGARLALALGLPSRPLPGGKNPRRLVVVIGRQGPDTSP